MLETIWESRWLLDFYGGVAQLGEHLPCKQGVKSSNLSISTKQWELYEEDKILFAFTQKQNFIDEYEANAVMK